MLVGAAAADRPGESRPAPAVLRGISASELALERLNFCFSVLSIDDHRYF